MNKPYSESCEQNREPILAVLKRHLDDSRGDLLEIGSGTGQHAVYFAAELPQWQWHTSDRPEYHPGILAWLADATSQNLHAPQQLDVSVDAWPERPFDAVYSANTAHIMHKPDVEAMVAGVASVLKPQGKFLLYGPFNVAGNYTAPSNERFDAWLHQRDPLSGVRDLEWLQELGESAGLELVERNEMPADNMMLCWIKQ